MPRNLEREALLLDAHLLTLGKMGYGLLLQCAAYRLNGLCLMLLLGMQAEMCF